MLRTSQIDRVRRNLRRVAGLPWAKKVYYIINTIIGETLRTRSIGTLGLRLVEIGLTRRCQCRCAHCAVAITEASSETNELTTSEVRSILDQVAAMHVTEVCFTGGEPLLRQDLVDLVRYAYQLRLVPKISTNGILLSDSLISKLKKAGLAWCAVSIDSAQPGQHDELRRYPGCYEKAIKGINGLVKHGIPTSIVTYTRKNSIYTGDLAEIVALGRTLNVAVVRINFLVPIGRLENQENQTLTFEEREEVRKLLKDGIVSMESPREGTRCTAAVTKIHITPNGDVTPCIFIPMPYGNVRQKSFREIWQTLADFDRMDKPKGHCPMCDPAFRRRLHGLVRQC